MLYALKKVGNTSNTHYNQKTDNSDAEVSSAGNVVIKGGYPFISSKTLFIPETLDIDRVLQNNPPTFKYRRDAFVYILDLIYSIPARKKDKLDTYTGYTPINKAILGSIIKDYRQYINYLKQQNIVEEDSYIVGEKSQGLRFKLPFRSNLKPVVITDWPLIKNINYLRLKDRTDEKATKNLHFLKNGILQLDCDIEEAKLILEKLKQEELNKGLQNEDVRYNSRLLPILHLHSNKTLPLFIVDKTAGRLHTNITQMKKELRSCLWLNEKPLYAVDIVNCQPYLCLSILDIEFFDKNKIAERIIKFNPNVDVKALHRLIKRLSATDDVMLFKKIVTNGLFYEEFGELLIKEGFVNNTGKSIRHFAKGIIFTTFFNTNYAINYNEAIKIFKKVFPNVYKIFGFIKRSKHNTLAILLQNLEADLILHGCCKDIHTKRAGISLITVHDSIATTRDNVLYVKNRMQRTFQENLGIAPKFKLEKW